MFLLFSPLDIQKAFQLKSHLSSAWQNFHLLCFGFLLPLYCLSSLLLEGLFDILDSLSRSSMSLRLSHIFISLFSFYTTFRILFRFGTPPIRSIQIHQMLPFNYSFYYSCLFIPVYHSHDIYLSIDIFFIYLILVCGIIFFLKC